MRVVELTNRAIKGAKYEWSNFTAARATWQQLARDQDETTPYLYKEPVRVVWDGVTILEGTIRKCSLDQSGDAWRWNIEACDILQPLEAALCFNPGGTLRGGVSAYAEVSGGSGADAPRKIKIAGTVRWALEDARKYGLIPSGVGIEVTVSPSAWMWDTALGCDMYAGVLRKLLAGRPGMVCWVDYSGSSPMIRVADGAGLPVVTLDRAQDCLSAISLSPRPDLVPPAVGVVLTAGRQACRSQVWPKGASLRQEGCVTTQVALSSTSTEDDAPVGSESPVWDFTKPIVEVRGVKLPSGADSNARKWWFSKVSQLSSVSGLQLGTIKKSVVAGVDGTDMSNYSTAESAQAYEHVSGQLSEACKTIKWCYVELKQYLYTDTRPPRGCEMLFPHTKQVDGKTRWYNWLRWQGRTINKSRMRYRVSKSGDSGGDDGSNPPSSGGGSPPSSTTDWPDYSSILREYYEITRAMPWEGRVNSLRALSPANLVGRRLAITGARRDYLEMATSVQGVTVDLAGKSTSINTGVPAHLSLQDMVDRVQQLASGQETLDQDQQQDNPMLTLQYDDEAYKSPDAPTLGPAGELVWTEAPDKPPVYDLQVELDWSDDNTEVTGYRMRRGKLMLQGVYIGQTPGDDTSGWFTKEGFTGGEIWLDVKFNGKGKLTGTSIMYEQGTVNPLILTDELADESEEFSYSFHIATVQDKEVYQHMLGTIQIPLNHGTFYPYGPAI